MKFNGATFNKAQQDQLKKHIGYISNTYNSGSKENRELIIQLCGAALQGKKVSIKIDNDFLTLTHYKADNFADFGAFYAEDNGTFFYQSVRVTSEGAKKFVTVIDSGNVSSANTPLNSTNIELFVEV